MLQQRQCSRRECLLALGASALVWGCGPGGSASAVPESSAAPEPSTPPASTTSATTTTTRVRWPVDALAAMEGEGRLGVALLDTGSGEVVGHRLDERFGMCSTFKLALAAMVLARVDAGALRLDGEVQLREADLVPHAPVTEARVRAALARKAKHATMTIGELAHAAQTTSDNPAANALLGVLGGPAGFTSFCRDHGDQVTRLDRLEPWMNVVEGDDPRDTTSPRAMATLIARLLGKGTGGLSAPSQALLRGWMIETQTGARRLRAGLPAAWVAGDKTGTMVGDGMTTRVNDIAWIEPPDRAPLVVATYFDTRFVAQDVRDQDEAVLAAVGRWIAAGV
ncbi:MAG: class A beta-lactamase [Deltaproteobacteria bacterium]|nr:class A beta-lactamase [Deltaproteobacteria bacterium]